MTIAANPAPASPAPTATEAPAPVSQPAPLAQAAPATAQAQAEAPKPAATEAPADPSARLAALEAKTAEQAKALEAATAKLATAEDAAYRALLGTIGLPPKLHALAPKVDPFNDAGVATLQKWADANADLCTARHAPTQAAAAQTEFEAKLAKAAKSPLVNAQAWRAAVAADAGEIR